MRMSVYAIYDFLCMAAFFCLLFVVAHRRLLLSAAQPRAEKTAKGFPGPPCPARTPRDASGTLCRKARQVGAAEWGVAGRAREVASARLEQAVTSLEQAAEADAISTHLLFCLLRPDVGRFKLPLCLLQARVHRFRGQGLL